MKWRGLSTRVGFAIAVACAALVGGAAQAAHLSVPATQICAPMSTAWDVNDAGTVAGYVGTLATTRAVTCSGNVIADLELPTDATGSIAVAINSLGQSAGQITLASGGAEAAVWDSSGAITRLGVLPGGLFSAAQDINDDGWVVGAAGGMGGTRAFVWRGSGPIEALPLPSGTIAAVAQGINNDGAIAGTAFGDLGPNRAVVWQAGGIVELPALAEGATASAVDINDAGQVVGNSSTTGPPWNVRNAVLWHQGEIVDLGSLGGSFGLATAIDGDGDVAGYMTNAANESRAFVWTSGHRTLMEPLDGDAQSFAFGMNGAGTIVGISNPTPPAVGRAVSWASPTDTTPPELDVSLSPNVLRPPNHKYVTVVATITATDDSGIDPTVELVSVTSNEPDNGTDDGNTVDDIVTTSDPTTVQLRAERAEGGTGRVYTLTYQATDGSGNSATRMATVVVPLS